MFDDEWSIEEPSNRQLFFNKKNPKEVKDFNRANYRRACLKAFNYARNTIVPNPNTRYITSTGNLAFNSFKYEWRGDDFHIYIDEDIAPYMVYTNEEWISPKWHGKKNPNEGWWNAFCEQFIYYLAKTFDGYLK